MKSKVRYFLLCALALSSVAHARGGGGGAHVAQFSELGSKTPWLTGPLLTPSGHTIPLGHFNFEPYFFWTTYSGIYDQNWDFQSTPHYTSATLQLLWQIGIAPRVEFDFAPQFYYNRCEGQSAYRVGDMPFTLGIELFSDIDHPIYPTLKLRLSANAPIGKYDNLNPIKLLTDVGGSGSWSPSIGLSSSQLFQFGSHFLSTRYLLAYGITVPNSVHGLSVYGGDLQTKGTAYPGNTLTALLGAEYTFTQRWVLACDLAYVHQNKNRFSGYSPVIPAKEPSSEIFSIAPALEYNFSTNIGLIGGAWVSFAGRNTPQYLNWVLALNIYH